MIEYQKGKLQLEQKQAAEKDMTANKNDSPTQLYLAAQRDVAADPLVKGSLTAYQAAIKDGDPTKIATAKSAYEQTVQERQSTHLAGVELHPRDSGPRSQSSPEIRKRTRLTEGQAGLTPENVGKKLQRWPVLHQPSGWKTLSVQGRIIEQIVSNSVLEKFQKKRRRHARICSRKREPKLPFPLSNLPR